MYQEGVELLPLDMPGTKNIVCPFCKNANKNKMYKGMRTKLAHTVWSIHCGECGGSGPRCARIDEALERFADPQRNLQKQVLLLQEAQDRHRSIESDLRNKLGDSLDTVLWAKRMARCISRLSELDTDNDQHFDD